MRRRPNTKIYYTPNSTNSADPDYEISTNKQHIIVTEINKNELINSSDELKKLREKLSAKLLQPLQPSNKLETEKKALKSSATDLDELWKQAGNVDIDFEGEELFGEMDKM